MAIEKKTKTRGIWTQTETTYTGATIEESWEVAAAVFSKTPEAIVRERIDRSIIAAKEVLEKAGYPIREGIYRQDDSGKFYWAAEYSAKEEIAAWGRVAWKLWPNFLQADSLTIEHFAIDLIKKARLLPLSIDEGTNNWNIALDSFHFGEAFWLFKIEHDGIALAAEKAKASRLGGKKGNSEIAENIHQRRDQVLKLALEYVASPHNSRRLSKRATADAIFQKLAVLECKSVEDATVKLGTIRKDLDALVQNKRIALVQSGRFNHVIG